MEDSHVALLSFAYAPRVTLYPTNEETEEEGGDRGEPTELPQGGGEPLLQEEPAGQEEPEVPVDSSTTSHHPDLTATTTTQMNIEPQLVVVGPSPVYYSSHPLYDPVLTVDPSALSFGPPTDSLYPSYAHIKLPPFSSPTSSTPSTTSWSVSSSSSFLSSPYLFPPALPAAPPAFPALSIYGVFDGHGGSSVAMWLARHFEEVLSIEVGKLLTKRLIQKPNGRSKQNHTLLTDSRYTVSSQDTTAATCRVPTTTTTTPTTMTNGGTTTTSTTSTSMVSDTSTSAPTLPILSWPSPPPWLSLLALSLHQTFLSLDEIMQLPEFFDELRGYFRKSKRIQQKDRREREAKESKEKGIDHTGGNGKGPDGKGGDVFADEYSIEELLLAMGVKIERNGVTVAGDEADRDGGSEEEDTDTSEEDGRMDEEEQDEEEDRDDRTAPAVAAEHDEREKNTQQEPQETNHIFLETDNMDDDVNKADEITEENDTYPTTATVCDASCSSASTTTTCSLAPFSSPERLTCHEPWEPFNVGAAAVVVAVIKMPNQLIAATPCSFLQNTTVPLLSASSPSSVSTPITSVPSVSSASTSFTSVTSGPASSASVSPALPEQEDGRAYIVCVNAGDSRAVLSRGGHAAPLSRDHKPQSPTEAIRIYHAGGSIKGGRVDGNLNLSRTLGDLVFKADKTRSAENQKITAYSDIRFTKVVEDLDMFLIVACDGIWDCLTNQMAVNAVHAGLLLYAILDMEATLFNKNTKTGIKSWQCQGSWRKQFEEELKASGGWLSMVDNTNEPLRLGDAEDKKKVEIEERKMEEDQRESREDIIVFKQYFKSIVGRAKKLDSICLRRVGEDGGDEGGVVGTDRPSEWPFHLLTHVYEEFYYFLGLLEEQRGAGVSGAEEEISRYTYGCVPTYVLSAICECICDSVIADGVYKCAGIGCDNMTCIVAQLSTKINTSMNIRKATELCIQRSNMRIFCRDKLLDLLNDSKEKMPPQPMEGGGRITSTSDSCTPEAQSQYLNVCSETTMSFSLDRYSKGEPEGADRFFKVSTSEVKDYVKVMEEEQWKKKKLEELEESIYVLKARRVGRTKRLQKKVEERRDGDAKAEIYWERGNGQERQQVEEDEAEEEEEAEKEQEGKEEDILYWVEADAEENETFTSSIPLGKDIEEEDEDEDGKEEEEDESQICDEDIVETTSDKDYYNENPKSQVVKLIEEGAHWSREGRKKAKMSLQEEDHGEDKRKNGGKKRNSMENMKKKI